MSYNISNKEKSSNLNSLSNIQLKEFGQTPEQLFFKPHPRRFSTKIVEIPLKENIENKNKSTKFDKEIKNNKKENKSNLKGDKNKNNEIKNNNKNKNDKIDEKEINIEEKENIKIEKFNNIGNVISKPFPIIKDIDFKLKKQYKSAKKFHNFKLVSGTICPEPNLIISADIYGHLNTYDYYSGEITKSFSLSSPIENINSINKNLVLYSSDYTINTFNISSEKVISSFYAHETKILNLFYDEKYKNFISC